MRWLLVASLLACGCRQVFGIHDPVVAGDGGAGDDAPIDTMIDSAPGCYGAPITICLDSQPLLPAMFGTTVSINTDQNPLCRPYTSPQNVVACVIAGTTVALNGGTLHVTGSKPLIVVSTSTMTLVASATVDVASHDGGMTGPGANAAACGTATPPGNTSTPGGGAGGSFGGAGGDGGHGGAGGGSGGVAAIASATPSDLRGGCAGTNGAGATAGAGGAGGGALLLVADSILVDGTIDASGAAGAGGMSPDGGGGGGGSGGLVVFEAASLTISSGAKVFASGAGGGEGGTSLQNGAPGHDPVGPTTIPTGGAGGTASAGDGGQGTYGTFVNGGLAGSGGANGSAGGGGGGGGAGYILVHASMRSIATNAVAPPVMP